MAWLTAWEKIASGPSSILASGDYGKKTTVWKTYGNKVVKCKYYTPTNPQTSLQQSWRGVFASAVSSWKALPDEEKASWRKIQKRVRCYRHQQPHNVYISLYLQGKPLDPTPWWEENGP